MNLLRLYGRVLALLGSESRLAWTLALANVALASAQFAEPVLLGRIIDTLTGAQSRGEPPSWSQLGMLLAAWAGFGLFTIACGTLIALYADRLAHRRRHVVLTDYFEHVLQLPLTYHGNTHSGRLDESHAAGYRRIVGPVGRVLPRSLLVIRFAARPAADLAVRQLAACLVADPVCIVFAGLTTLIGVRPTPCKAGRTPLLRPCRARVRYAWQHRAGAELFPLRNRSHGIAPNRRRGCWPHKCRSVVVGTGRRVNADLDHIDRARDHHRRHAVEHQRPGDHRRDGHFHEFRRPNYYPAGADRRFINRVCRKRRG